MIDKAGASGWMNDFGEALPFDARLRFGADPAVWHNRYPEEWALVSREAVEELGRDDIVFFNRSGFTQSPGAATLFWLGDQLQSWDEYDGIKTAVVGLLLGGVSGFSLLHSDTGGYVVLKLDLLGRTFPVIARTPELFMRWIKSTPSLRCFARTKGSIRLFQHSSTPMPIRWRICNASAKSTKASPLYRKRLVVEAAHRGFPVVRHLFLHYPDDPNTFDLRYQFLLGADLLVAPVLDQGADSVEVYFPEGSEWVDLWTGAEAGKSGEWMRMPAPLSKPAVFLRKGSPSPGDIIDGLRQVGVI